MKRWFWIPLVIFAGFCAFVGWQLMQEKDDTVHSRMIGQPLPEFSLAPASTSRPGATTADFVDGKPHLLNIWASWCIPCAAEAPQLEALQRGGADIIGVAIRDRPEDVDAFLARYGNPYSRIGADNVSAVQMGIGSAGVPETFVIDGKGVIRYQHIGDIRQDDVPMLLARLKEASQ